MSEVQPTVTDLVTEQRDAFAERLMIAGRDAVELATVYLGERLGLYDALGSAGFSTSAELAALTNTHERYVREWLQQQTIAGILEVEDATRAPSAQRFRIPEAYLPVLVDRLSTSYAAAGARVTFGLLRPLAAVLDAFRSGDGVPYAAFGLDLVEGMGDSWRPFADEAAPGWLATLPELQARLSAEPPARIAEFGCGVGWDSIGIAHAYPLVRVDGFDLDGPSIAQAQANAVVAEVADRVTFQVRDAGDPTLSGSYDLVLAIFTVHDLPRPVEVLRIMRRLAGNRGMVLVCDPKAGESFADDLAAPDDFRGNYAAGVVHCLPVGMFDQPSAATGIIMRPATLRRYAQDAGFRNIEVLPIEAKFFSVYRLIP
jgi:SAM-dependent methyltransferase